MYFGNERQHSSLKCHMSTPPPKPVVGAQGREKVIKIVWDAGGKDKDPPPPPLPDPGSKGQRGK